MKRVTFSAFRARPGELFEAVEQGERVVLTWHGRAVAEVMPVTLEPELTSEPTPTDVPAWKRPRLRLPLRGEGPSLSQMIIDEREERERAICGF